MRTSWLALAAGALVWLTAAPGTASAGNVSTAAALAPMTVGDVGVSIRYGHPYWGYDHHRRHYYRPNRHRHYYSPYRYYYRPYRHYDYGYYDYGYRSYRPGFYFNFGW
jgi:hypothetical protein